LAIVTNVGTGCGGRKATSTRALRGGGVLIITERRWSMSAYFIVQATITDQAQFQKYREAVVPFIASFGGKFAARGAKVEVFEGEHDMRSVVMFEFPDMKAIRAFWNSPDYEPIKKLREGAATLNVWAFPGV
jgi:uncharacterized protein (DUF1330 family)